MERASSLPITMPDPNAGLRIFNPSRALNFECGVTFPEWYFMPMESRREMYRQRVTTGYEKMRHRRVVIAGLARNIGSVVEATIARIEHLGTLFRDYRVLIYENDSADRTRDHLMQWVDRNDRVTLETEDLNDPVHGTCRSLTRAERMAYYRNQCHQYICENHADCDEVILVDTDLEGGWSYDGVAHTFGCDNWDFVGAFGVIFKRHYFKANCLVHYDAWAYRTDESFTPMTTGEVNSIIFHRGDPLVPVTSCFGGIGVYRMPAFQCGTYDGSDTEHVTFHRRLRKNGFDRMFLNPSLIALYGRRHRSLDSFARTIGHLVDRLSGREFAAVALRGSETKRSREKSGLILQ